MSQTLSRTTLEELRTSLRGALLQPGDEQYDSARRVWNGMIDRKPALIVRCAGAADIIAAVNFARTHQLLISVRGGGHNVTGNAVCDDGMMIDLSPMKGIRVDPVKRIAYAQAGLTWGEFDHETQAFGLAVTGGQIPSTGIAGLTLGGGVGWLMRSCGLVVDNLLSVDIVTADGRLLTASATENEDLFWGVRGGGGNFGIVTSFVYRLHKVGPTVLGGMLLYPAARARELLYFYRTFTAGAPDTLGTTIAFLTAPPAPFIPQHLQGTAMVAIILCYNGPIEDGLKVVQPLRDFAPPVADLLKPLPYTAIQGLLNASAPSGLQVYLKSDHLRSLSDEAIETILTHTATRTSPLSTVLVMPLGGAVGRVGALETAFGYRDATYHYVIFSIWSDPEEAEQHITWTRQLWTALRPFANGTYVNELGEEGEERIRDAYLPEAYRRLAALKQKYDPTNLFHLNQNIKPAADKV